MSELNKKNINYGALNRFLQNLRSHDLSGLATEQYVDDAIVDVKPITNVSALPDAEEHLDNIIRTNLSDIYVVNHLEDSSNAPQLYPDFLQINNAYCAGAGDVDYYKGAYDLVCSDGTIHAFRWGNSNSMIMISLKNAQDIHYKTDLTGDALFYISNRQDEGWQEGWTLNETYAENLNVTVNDVLSNALSDSTDEYGVFKAVTYMPEESQVGNAYIEYNNVDYFYTGEQITITYSNTQYTVYKLVNETTSVFLGLTVPINLLYKDSTNNTYTGAYELFSIDGNNITGVGIHLMTDNDIYIVSGKLSWNKLVTEDEIASLEARIAALENA